jgi:G3E family GTPase
MVGEQIGISIITGFLGAGKTSLLNHILIKEKSYKFAIIENEFSKFGIDAEIISGIERQNIVELSNGCICCNRNTELLETLTELILSGLKFNHLLIETTGIAVPDPIVQSIVSNIDLKEKFYIDSIICLVDSVNYFSDIEKPEAAKQISMAELVIVNKIDKCDAEKLEKIEESIFKINPLCKVIRTNFSDYGNNILISGKEFNYQEFEKTFNHLSLQMPFSKKLDNSIQSISIQLNGDFIPEKFRIWMEYFLMLNQSNIYRTKGILSFNGNSRKIIFQAVKSSFTIDEGDYWQSNVPRLSRIIFIGMDLNKKDIEESLQLLMIE